MVTKVKRIGKTGINTTFVVNKSFLKYKIRRGDCQYNINKKIKKYKIAIIIGYN